MSFPLLPHTDHSFLKPFCLLHWMKQVLYTKRSCYRILKSSQLLKKHTISLKSVGFLDFTVSSLYTYPAYAFQTIKSNFLYPEHLAASSYNPKPEVGVLTVSDPIKIFLWFLSPLTSFQTSPQGTDILVLLGLAQSSPGGKKKISSRNAPGTSVLVKMLRLGWNFICYSLSERSNFLF